MKPASVGLCTTPCGVTLNWSRVTKVLAMAMNTLMLVHPFNRKQRAKRGNVPNVAVSLR